jgi:Tol biopolymer transport system component
VTARLLPVAVVALLLAMPADASFPGANGLIAFVHQRGIGNDAIEVVRPDGSDRATIVLNGKSPSWSPDGKRLVFDAFRGGKDTELFVVNADGTGLRRIKNPGTGDFEPAWSPEGRHIAFMSRPNGSAAFEIYVVNADGSGRRLLTRNYIRD